MSNVKRAYFIAGGRALESILAWNAKRETALAAYSVFFEKMGICYASGTRTGHTFRIKEDAQPKAPGLRLDHGSRYNWVFDRKTPEGKALAKEWNAIHAPSSCELNIGAESIIAGDMCMHNPAPELIGTTWVISCPYLEDKAKEAPKPWDSTPIKTSEYWAMKEAVEPAKATA